MVKSLFNKARTGFAMGLIAFASIAGGSLAYAQSAYAASCDKVNIVYCGLSGSNAQGYINSMKSHWNNNNPADFRQIAQWGGWTGSVVANMNTNNTKVGTLNANTGAITVGGRVVGTNTHMSARFNGGRGFYPVKSGVWARPITVNHARSSYQVVITFNAQGKAIAGIAVECGNIIKFTPPPPPPAPKPVLTCTNLRQEKVAGTESTWKFTATAAKKNTTIKNFEFKFGDGKTERVATSNTQASVRHTFTQPGKKYTVRAFVNGADQKDVTGPNCVVTVRTAKTPPPPPPPVETPSVVITKEVSKEEVAINEQFTYTLKVANNGNLNLTNVVVSDNAPDLVEFVSAPVGNLTPKTWNTTIASLKIGETVTFTIIAKATGESDNIVNTACVDAPEVPGTPDDCDEVPVTVPPKPTPECKPGIPVGSPECEEAPEECKPGIPVGSPECEEQPPVVITPTTPPTLPNTGAGSTIATILLVTLASAAAHYVYLNGMPKLSLGRRYEN